MMRRIVSAGLPSYVASTLARQLDDVSVLITFTGDDTLAEVGGGRVSLLLLDSDITGLPAESVLQTLREDPAFDTLPIVYCLAENDKATQETSRQRLLRDIEHVRVLLHPLSLAEVTRVTNLLLDQRAGRVAVASRDLRALGGTSQQGSDRGPAEHVIPVLPSLPLRRAS